MHQNLKTMDKLWTEIIAIQAKISNLHELIAIGKLTEEEASLFCINVGFAFDDLPSMALPPSPPASAHPDVYMDHRSKLISLGIMLEDIMSFKEWESLCGQ